MGCPCNCDKKKAGRYRFKFSTSMVEDMDYIDDDQEQAIAVLNYYFKNKPITGIEIGTMSATLTTKILDRVKIEKLITIDAWKHMKGRGHEAEHIQSWHDRERNIAINLLKKHSDKVFIMRMESGDALEYLISTGEKFDFVWIDGGHDYLTVCKDVELGWELLKEDGLIGGTNFMQVLEVTVAVGKFLKEKNTAVSKGGDYVWWHKRTNDSSTSI